MAIYKEDYVDIDLTGGNIHRSFLSRSIGEGDALANRFGVRVLRDGEPVNLGGCVCSGYFIRSTGDTVTITGSISGNKAYVDLPQACYAYEGQFALAIKIAGDSVTGTMRIVDGMVMNTTTGSVVDPGTVIPSVEDLIEAIEEAVASIPADYSELWEMFAPNYSTSETYEVGECVTYDGKIYRCVVAITESESWTAAHWQRTSTGAEIFDNRRTGKADSAFINAMNIANGYELNANVLTPGTYTSAAGFDIVASDLHIRTRYPLFVPRGTYVYVNVESSIPRAIIGQYDLYEVYQTENRIEPDGTNTWFSDKDQYIIIDIPVSSVSSYDGGVFVIPPIRNITPETNKIIRGTTTRTSNRYNFITSTTRLRLFNQVYLKKGDYIKFKAGTNVKFILVEFIAYSSLAYYSTTDWLASGSTIAAPVDALCTLIFKNADGSTITVSDYDAEVSIVSNEIKEVIELEWGSISSDTNRTYTTSLSHLKNAKRSKLFLDVGKASGISCDAALAGTGVYLLFYASDQTFISSANFTGGFISIPSSCVYVGVYSENTGIEKVGVTLYGCDSAPKFVKRVARMGSFPTNASELLLFSIKDDNLAALRLLLPSNYTPEGDPVPLIVWMRGSSGSSAWNEDFGDTYGTHSDAMKTYISYLRDEGFAVCAMKTFGSYYANKYNVNVERASPYVIPTCLLAMEKGVDYVCSRYNVDRENVHLLGHSQGGQLETYYVTHPFNGLRSVGMFSPVNDYLSMPGDDIYADTRKVIAEDLGLTGDTAYFGGTGFNAYSDDALAFFTENIEKINYLNEAWTGLIGAGDMETRMGSALADGAAFWQGGTAHTDLDTIYTDYTSTKLAKVPVKIWGAPDDNATPYRKMVEIIKQFQNSGCRAEMRSFSTGTGKHHAATWGNLMSESVTTKTGAVYTDLPVAWYEAVQFMRENMAKA